MKPKTARNRLNYAKKYGYCLFNGDLTELQLIKRYKRVHAMKALSALSKFLGVYDEWMRLVKNYGLKWSAKSNDDLIIERLTKTVNPSELFEWIKTVKKAIPELSAFMDFMVVTGLRFVEALESYNLIIRLANEGKLDQYYNAERKVLEHFRFKELFIRRTKKAFVSFVPHELVERIAEAKPLTEDIIDKRLRRRGIPAHFGDLRELHANLLLKNLRQIEVDFLHGRVSTTVFMTNYFNPTWITDIRKRVFRSIAEIRKQIA
jgi:intergrase/recombinase